MTAEQLKRVHIALEQAGTIQGAASLVGMSAASLSHLCKTTPELRSYLKNAPPPTDEETIARPALLTEGERDLSAAVEKADKQVRRGFDAIGVKGKALDQAMAFRDFGKFHFHDLRHYISGGVAKLFADLMADIEDVRKDLEEKMSDVEYQKMLREDRSRLVKLALDTYDRTRQAALDAATIEAKKLEAKNGANNRKGKPAFAPLAIKCDTVVVNENGHQAKGTVDTAKAT